MSNVFFILLMLSVVSFGVTVVMAIIKAIKKNPVAKVLKFTGLSVFLVIVSFVGFGLTYDGSGSFSETNNAALSSTRSEPSNTPATNIDEGKATETVEAISNNVQDTTQTANNNTPTAETYKYSGDKLKEIYDAYMGKQKDSDKNKLKESDPQELYKLILTSLNDKCKGTNVTTQIINSRSYINNACSLFLDIFDSYSESSSLKQINKLSADLSNSNSEIKKILSKYDDKGDEKGLLRYRDICYQMDFYIKNGLKNSYNDSNIVKLLKNKGIYVNSMPQAFAATSDFTYNELFGYFPGESYCAVQPIDEYKFTKSDVYSLNVIEDGTMELIDNKGFKFKAPVYIELDDDFISEVNKDIDKYCELFDNQVILTFEISKLLGISTNTANSNYSNFTGYWISNRYSNSDSEYSLFLQVDGMNVSGEISFCNSTTANSAEFTGKIENNNFTAQFEDSYSEKGTLILSFIDDMYIKVELKYQDGSVWCSFPQGEALMTIVAD